MPCNLINFKVAKLIFLAYLTFVFLSGQTVSAQSSPDPDFADSGTWTYLLEDSYVTDLAITNDGKIILSVIH